MKGVQFEHPLTIFPSSTCFFSGFRLPVFSMHRNYRAGPFNQGSYGNRWKRAHAMPQPPWKGKEEDEPCAAAAPLSWPLPLSHICRCPSSPHASHHPQLRLLVMPIAPTPFFPNNWSIDINAVIPRGGASIRQGQGGFDEDMADFLLPLQCTVINQVLVF